jgi:hypothetical protein
MEGRLNSAAAGVVQGFGKVAAQVDALNRLRAALASELGEVLSTAQDMLADLGDDVATGRRRARKVVRKATKKRKRNLSPEGRARIIAAVKKRWANQKAAQKKR